MNGPRQWWLAAITSTLIMTGCAMQPAIMADQTTLSAEEAADAQTRSVESGLTVEQLLLLDQLKSQGVAPELTNDTWFNSEPLQLANLRGKVVIVEFWTFGCINCKNVIPALREWHQTYADAGLTIIGVHTPEFSYERDLASVQEAIARLNVPYPVAVDNEWTTWRAYNNRYWPAMYVIDKQGHLRFLKIGEGGTDRVEKVIQALLAEPLSS